MISQLYEKVRWWLIVWLARRLPTCKDTTRLTSDSLERKLPLRQRIEMRLHILICVWCERYMRQLLFLREAMHEASRLVEKEVSPSASSLSPEARERLKRALSSKNE
ncbi:MAG: zf-HC2 domain-containing protein [Acidobacteria bacterium]|nr:zf-HC2 domain-containing protein [Acidobacteriota bacterium]